MGGKAKQPGLAERLFFAARDGEAQTVAGLLKLGVSPNLRELSSGMTPLHLAVHHGDAEMVRLLLDHGAAPDVHDHSLTTPLHLAACHGYTKIVRKLLAAGAEVDCQNKREFTPLHDAACEGHAEIVRILLNAGADINAAAEKKQTPIHMASYHGRRKAVEVLIKRGAFLHGKTVDGDTALIWAASQGHLPVVRLLLDAPWRDGRDIKALAEAPEASAEARELCRKAGALRCEAHEESTLAEAETLFREAIRRFPLHWEGYFGLAELMNIKLNHARSFSDPLIDEMVASLRRAIELAPNQIEPQLKLASIVANTDVADAELLYRAAIDTTDPKSHALYEELLQAGDHWNIGIEAAEQGGYDSLALEAFCRAIDLEPDFYGGYVKPEPKRAQALWSLALLVKPGKGEPTSRDILENELQEALDEAMREHWELSSLSEQTMLLTQRYQRTGALADLEEALEVAQQALALAPAHPQALANRGYVLLMLYERDNKQQYLKESIASYESAIEKSGSNIERLSYLNNLSFLWHSLYLRSGKLEHLEQSIASAREIVNATPASSPLYPKYLQNLGLKLLERYKSVGAVEDLQSMIELSEQALNGMLPGSSYRGPLLNNFAIALRNRFALSRDIDDLSRAIDYFDQALRDTPENSLDYLIRLHGLGSGLLDRYLVDGKIEDLERAIACLEIAAERSDPSSTRFPLRLANLAEALRLRYKMTGHEPFLQRSIAQCERLDLMTAPDSPLLPGYLFGLGAAVTLQWERTRSDDDYRRAVVALRRAVEDGRGVPVQTVLAAAHQWLLLAVLKEEWDEAQRAYGYAWDASERLVRIQFLRRDKESWLEHAQGLSASAAFAFAKTDRLAEAAEALERGQARLLSETLAKEKTAFEQLVSSGHADLLVRYRDAICQIRHLSDSEVPFPEARAGIAQAQAEVEHILEAVQGLEGLEDFLRPATFADIQRAAAIRPLIYIAATTAGGFALVIGAASAEFISPVWLPELTTHTLEIALWGTESGEHGLLGAQRAWQQSRGLHRRKAWLSAFEDCGRWLWDSTLAPVLQAVPTLCEAALVPIGPLSLLPFHAAWREDPNRSTGRAYLLDLLTVTYSPNARTLLGARVIAERVAPRKLLAIDQPSSTRTPALPSAAHEVRAVAAQFTDPTIIRHKEATRDNVLSALPGHDVLHFCCHGRAELVNPLSSALLMAGDQLLTLGDILKLQLEGVRLAVLSACETGVPGLRLPEEVVSLPSGLLQAGAAGVISSLASVEDFSTMLLISSFYSLWQQGVPDPAEALRRAQIWMRDTTNGDKVQAAEEALQSLSRPGSPCWPPETARAILAELGPRNPEARDFSHPSHWGCFYYVGA